MKMKWMKTAVALVLCLVMVSVSVVAAAVTVDGPIEVPDEDGVHNKQVDNVDVSFSPPAVRIGDSPLEIRMNNNASLIVSDSIINNGTDMSSEAANILIRSGYEAFLSVVNSVIANVYGTGEEDVSAIGIRQSVRNKNSVAKATIGGDVIAQATFPGSSTRNKSAKAIFSYAETDGEIDLYVGGSVIADADNGDAVAIEIYNQEANTQVEVRGNVTATGNEQSYALFIDNSSWPNANEADQTSGVDVFVGGSVSSTGDGLIIQSAYDDSQTGSAPIPQTTVEIRGDLTADNRGIVIQQGISSNALENATVIVNGTVSGTKGAVVIDKNITDTSTPNLVVWKIEPDENGALVQWEDGDAEDVEKNIWYIIHVEQPEDGATLTATGTGQIVGRDTVYEVAHEGDTVYLNAVMMPGWRILNAYWDEYQSELMTALNDRTFYMVVPHGGGVVLSALLQQTLKPQCVRPNITVTYRDPADSATAYAGGYLTVNPNKKTGKHYMVAMVGNGGTIDGRSALTKSVKEGDSLTLPIPVQDGKTFLGWSTGDNTELIPGGTSVVITEKVAYRAMWN